MASICLVYWRRCEHLASTSPPNDSTMDDLKAVLLEPSGSSFSSGINVLAKAQVAALCGHTWRLGIKSGACLGGMTSNPDGRSICWYQPGSTWIFLKVASFTQNLPEIWRAEIVYPYCRLRGPFFCTGEFHRNILYMYQLVMTNIAMENHHAINT